VEAEGILRLNPDDAARLNVSAGDRVTLSNERGSFTACVKLLERVPKGFAWFPDHFAQDMTQLCEITIDKDTKVPSFRTASVSVVKVE
jgi:formate dehydrogenase alpha subunit